MTLEQLNKQRWDACRIPETNAAAFRNAATIISAHRERYEKVSKATGVPWWFIGVVHYRESSNNFNTYLGNGQPLNKKTTIVPKGRGPFNTWEDGAVDALVNCPPYAARNKNWSVGPALALLEKYNGLGYASKGVPSPYLWAGTNQYVKGKYVSDGVYNPNVIDKQLGCAGLLKFMGIFKTVDVADTSKKTGILAAIGASIYSVYNYGIEHWPYFLAAGAAIATSIGVYNFIKFRKGKLKDVKQVK